MAGPRNILITGGTTGIGLALVERLGSNHRIMTTGRTMTARLEKLVELYPDVNFVKADFTEPHKATAVLKKALKKAGWEKLDNAIFNAGTGIAVESQLEGAASIRDTLDVNLTSNIALAQMLFPLLKKSRGKLTFIGSLAYRGKAGLASYAASKAGLHGFARALREEWRGKVFVQILHLGATKTGMHEKAGLNVGIIKHFFTSARTMAAMIDKSIAGSRFSVKLSFFQDWTGATFLARGLR